MKLRMAWRNNQFSLSVKSRHTRKTLFSAEMNSSIDKDVRVTSVLEYMLYKKAKKFPSKMQMYDSIALLKNGEILRDDVLKSDVKMIAHLIQNCLVSEGEDLVLEKMMMKKVEKKLYLGTRITYVNRKVFPDMVRIK